MANHGLEIVEMGATQLSKLERDEEGRGKTSKSKVYTKQAQKEGDAH